MPLEIGVLLPSRQPGARGNPATSLVAAARRAEAAGFDSVWVGDSLVARPRLEPLTALAAVAAATSSVQLGTAILLAALRAPLVGAHALATIDLVSEGRLIVGVGAGASVPATEDDFRAAGAHYEGRIRRLYETVRIWRALWAGEPAPESPCFPEIGGFELAPRPARPAGPAVWLAGEGPKTLVRAGREFDGWLPFSPTPEAFAAGADAVTASAIASGRKPPTAAVYLTVTIDTDRGRAEREQADFAESYYGAPYQLMRAVQAYAAGTVDEVAEWVDGYVRAGASHLVLRLAGSAFEAQLERAASLASVVRNESGRRRPSQPAAEDVPCEGAIE